MKLSSFVLASLLSSGALSYKVPITNLEIAIDHATDLSFATDDQIVQRTLDTLYHIGNDTETTKCTKCKERLLLGKSLALTRPDLVSTIWTQWCLGTGKTSSSTCKSTYARNTVKSSFTGTNFANMLTLIDPASLDGDYYCHYKESSACDLPTTPDVDISYMWPEKPEKAYSAPEPSDEKFNVLHISDFHIELDYTVGAEANCSSSMCCTPHSKNSLSLPEGYDFTDDLSDDEVDGLDYYNSTYAEGEFVKGDFVGVNGSVWEPAYTFGHYECDAPEILINSSLDSIVEFQQENNITFDFAIFTGDLVDHDELVYTGYDMTVDSEVIVFRDIKYKLKDIPVFSVLGNHDTFPYGEIAQEGSGFENMFNFNADLMAELWNDYGWLDWDDAQYAKYHYTGFSVTTARGLKVISLNSNCWYIKNHYNYHNMTDNPDSFGQFQFLVDELVEAEENDQRVWIISHIPTSNSDILPIQAKLFTDVVERFSPYTIASIFHGHTHRDEFSLLYKGNGTDSDSKTEENLINFAWIEQAVTPWVENNPGWRYYEIDAKTFSVMESFNYFTRLNDTFYDHGEEPVWQYEYSARDAYGVDWDEKLPLNASYWHKVAESIRESKDSLQTYEDYSKRLSPYTSNCLESTDCDWDWCYVTSFTNEQAQNCYDTEGTSPPSY